METGELPGSSPALRSFRTDLVCVPFLLIAVSGGVGEVSGLQTIGDSIACPGCSLNVSPLTTFGTEDGPAALQGAPFMVIEDSHGRFWFIHHGGPPLVFAEDGGFLQEVGRLGQGPGEFASPRLAAPVGDSVLVYDQGRRILNVFGPDLRHVRSVNLPQLSDVQDMAAVAWPRTVVLSALGGSPDHVGWPLHVIDASGGSASVLRSFGSNDGVLLPATSARRLLDRRVATGMDGKIWSLSRREYLLTAWTSEGVPSQRLHRAATWFPQPADRLQWSPGGPERAPDPIMSAVRVDAEGHLWVYAHVASATWQQSWTREMREAVRDNPAGVQRRSVRPYRPREADLYHTMIELLDPETAQVLTRRRIEGYVVGVLGDGRIATYHETEFGIPYIAILAVELSPDR